MSILITADFQGDYQNLDLCTQAWTEIINICLKEEIRDVILAGDLKQLYNPVDVRVTRWWFDAIKSAKESGIRVICNLGNHDRLGLYVSTENWFPILRKAGAQCYDKPAVVQIAGMDVAFLPYRNSPKLVKEMSDSLASQVKKPSILIFHGEVCGAKYNQFGERTTSGIQESWLHADRYSFCVGGHFHLQQKIGENIYYCGSPFAQDWGEANQRKGYLITDGKTIKSVPSKIPGWYDPTWPNFEPPKSWRGTRVRVHISTSSVAYVSEVERARERAQALYEGAEISVNATVRKGREESGEALTLSITDPDQVKIREYIKQTCPDNVSLEKVERYLTTKVEAQTGRWQRTGTGVKFIRAKAYNFLSFEEVEVDWSKKGIVVVQGTNKDRSGKSNGSGKTSLLQTIPVALFGSTFKGQKHDKWAKRGRTDTAKVILELRDGKNRTIRIVRSRKPSQLRLWVDGKEQSTGMKPQDKDGTQSLIEKLTGFTWQTLANAVYIDQEVAYEFVAGTKKSRTDVLSKIQNLERFAKALEAVKKGRSRAEGWAREVEESMSVLDERIDGCKKKLALLVEERDARLDEAQKELAKRRDEKEKHDGLVEPLIKDLAVKLGKAEAAYEQAREKCEKRELALDNLKLKRDVLIKQRPQIGVGYCSMCRQSVSEEHLLYINKTIDKALKELVPDIDDAKEKYTKSLQVLALAEAEYEKIGIERNKLIDAQKRIALSLTECERSFRELQRREHNEGGRKQEVKTDVREAQKQRKALEDHQRVHRSDLEFYQYCEKALSRDGIPAFLNALLCGPLNTAAEFYSELFADKALQICFELENGEFVPMVLNATGGESIEDQSDGERALAGLIASFALRETAPKCNLLILDEPGNGLDPSAARQFAKGLRGLIGKFDSIWLTTHNSAIASELVDQQVLNVTKQNGVSIVKEN